MKRKRGDNGDISDALPAVIQFPPLESTILIESGGVSGTNASTFSSDLSGNLGGVRRLQYNNPMWKKDFFTTTYQNTVAALIVSIYQNGGYNTCLFPITLPRQLLTSFSQENTSPDSDSEHFYYLQKSLAYALNLLLSKDGYVIAFNRFVSIGLDETHIPLLQDGKLPPILFDVHPLTGQLYIKKNPDYVSPYSDYDIAFTIATLYEEWFPSSIPQGKFKFTGTDNGWFGSGALVFGFGQYDPIKEIYEDQYYNKPIIRGYLKSHFMEPTQKALQSYENWQNNIVKDFLFYQDVQCCDRTTTLLASRYFFVISRQLSRLQLRPVISNIPSGANGVISILYNDANSAGIYQSGSSAAILSPVIHYDPRQSHNEVDISIVNEYGQEIYSFPNSLDPFYMAYHENNDDSPGAISVPLAFHVLDPYFTSNGPNHDCLFPYYKINQGMLVNDIIPLQENEIYASKPSTSISHFIRVIGS